MKLNVGLWYSVRGQGTDIPTIQPRPDLVDRPVRKLFLKKLNKIYNEINLKLKSGSSCFSL